ncbi:MAG TPA: hypothetical protein VM261_14285 [Kofleriaceae bacterium]|nr:hypothetical protein [Kofleriaceae bacterium]
MAGDRADVATTAWDDATSALARGDTETFVERSRRAALLAAADGDVAGARELAALRDRVLLQSTASEPSGAFAQALAAIAGGEPDGVALSWHLARALLPELPEAHPFIAAANELGWSPLALAVVLAALAVGDAADLDVLAVMTGADRDALAPVVDELVAQGALVAEGVGLVTAAPILAAACAGRPSTAALAPTASYFPAETFVTDVFRAAGVVVAIAPEPSVAIAGLRASRLPVLESSLDVLRDPVARGWIVREARWQTVPLLVELDRPVDPALLEIAASVPRAIVVPAAAEDAAAALAVLGTLGVSVRTWESVALSPATSAAIFARAFGVPVEQLDVGQLHAADIDELLGAVGKRGGEGVIALAHELQRRATAALSPFVFGAAPELPPGVLDRARELLATDGAWGGRMAVLVAPLVFAAPIALGLASDRGVVAATLALGAADVADRMPRALGAARRWGAVLCVGIDRASPAVIEEFARQLGASGVTAVIAVRPGTPLPRSLTALSVTLMI